MEQFCAMKSQTRDGVLLVPIYRFQKQKKFNQHYARGVLCLVSFFLIYEKNTLLHNPRY